MTPDEERAEIRRLSEINRRLKRSVTVNVFTTEALNLLAAKLFDHATGIANPVHPGRAGDCRLAARALSNFATLRFRVAEIAEAALTQDGAAIRRDLIDAIADAAWLSPEGTF